MIGTNVLESTYDETMAKPTASVSGMNSDRSGSCMTNAGMNTERMQSRASSRGTAVALAALSTAVAMFFVRPIWTCVFSIVTVASSTRMPMASAMPPSDMMLIVFPVTHDPTSDPVRASGMLATTTSTLRTSRRNRRIISPVSPAPIAPSVATLSTACTTVGDSSNSKLIFTSSGTAARNCAMDLWTSETTVSVEPVSFLIMGKWIAFLPSTSA